MIDIRVTKSSKSIDEGIRIFLKENPDLKRALEIFSVSEKEYAEVLRSQNEVEQMIYTNSTGEAESGYLRADSK